MAGGGRTPGEVRDYQRPPRHQQKGIRHMDFFSSWYFIGIMAFLLVALVGLLIFLRMKPPAE